MGVIKEIIQPGDGKTFPKSGDQLTMHYQLRINLLLFSCFLLYFCLFLLLIGNLVILLTVLVFSYLKKLIFPYNKQNKTIVVH
jgi:hypothetical protein